MERKLTSSTVAVNITTTPLEGACVGYLTILCSPQAHLMISTTIRKLALLLHLCYYLPTTSAAAHVEGVREQIR